MGIEFWRPFLASGYAVLKKCMETLLVASCVELPFGKASVEVPRGEKMLHSGTDPESYIIKYTLVCEDQIVTATPTQHVDRVKD